MDGSDVANLILDGVAPEKAPLKLVDGKEVILNKREFEIEVTEKDGAIYLIENLRIDKDQLKKLDTEKMKTWLPDAPKKESINNLIKAVETL